MLSMIDVDRVREDFPILKRRLKNGKSLVYFDNAATTQKPRQVIDAIYDYYMNYNSNIHRGVHQLAVEATEAYESSRAKAARFINAGEDEVIFTRNTTEAINLVAYAWARKSIQKGDCIVITELEHHSNIVPWQMVAKEKGARLDYIRVNLEHSDNGSLVLDDIHTLLRENNVRLVAVSHMSNVLGTIIPVKDIIKACKNYDNSIKVLVDGAQSTPHMPINVKDMQCDFFAFSAHKMLGPTGVGVLYAERGLLDTMDPFLTGGDMIREVHKYDTRWNDLPWRFEAGTPNIADVIGFGAAIDYLDRIGMSNIRAYEHELTKYMISRLTEVKDIRVYGSMDADERGAVFSFTLADIHPHDLASILDEDGVAIRSGHHCAQPLMERLGLAATSRASLYIYNTKEEIDRFIESLNRARLIFRLG